MADPIRIVGGHTQGLDGDRDAESTAKASARPRGVLLGAGNPDSEAMPSVGPRSLLFL